MTQLPGLKKRFTKRFEKNKSVNPKLTKPLGVKDIHEEEDEKQSSEEIVKKITKQAMSVKKLNTYNENDDGPIRKKSDAKLQQLTGITEPDLKTSERKPSIIEEQDEEKDEDEKKSQETIKKKQSTKRDSSKESLKKEKSKEKSMEKSSDKIVLLQDLKIEGKGNKKMSVERIESNENTARN